MFIKNHSLTDFSMKKIKNSIYVVLILIYSLITISLFTGELAICFSFNCVKVKALNSNSYDGYKQNHHSSIKEHSDCCKDCLVFQLLPSQGLDEHFKSHSRPIKENLQREVIALSYDITSSFIKNYRKNPKYLSYDRKSLPSSSFLLTLRTVSLQI